MKTFEAFKQFKYENKLFNVVSADIQFLKRKGDEKGVKLLEDVINWMLDNPRQDNITKKWELEDLIKKFFFYKDRHLGVGETVKIVDKEGNVVHDGGL